MKTVGVAGKKRGRFDLRRLLSTAVIAVCAYIGYASIFGSNGWLDYRHKKAEYQHLSQDLERVKDDNERLQNHIHALKTDPKAIEKEAREQLKYAKPGEVIYVDSSARQPQTAPATQK